METPDLEKRKEGTRQEKKEAIAMSLLRAMRLAKRHPWLTALHVSISTILFANWDAIPVITP